MRPGRSPGPPAPARRVSAWPSHAACHWIFVPEESQSVLVSLCVDPECRRVLERRPLGSREGQGRQIPVEADELQLREHSDQPARQPCWTTGRAVAAEQALELLAGHPLPRPEIPVEGPERSPEAVLQLVHLLSKA